MSVKPNLIQPGWVLFHGTGAKSWHYVTKEQTTLCQAARRGLLTHSNIEEWRKEPRGRHDACHDCSKRLIQYEAKQREEERRKLALASAPVNGHTSQPESAPEVLMLTKEELVAAPVSAVDATSAEDRMTLAQAAELVERPYMTVYYWAKQSKSAQLHYDDATGTLPARCR